MALLCKLFCTFGKVVSILQNLTVCLYVFLVSQNFSSGNVLLYIKFRSGCAKI